MCHESSGDALDRDDRDRQGQRLARGHRGGRPADRRRAEPGHQPPADAHRRWSAAKQRGATIVSDQPAAARPGSSRFDNPQSPRGLLARDAARRPAPARSASTATSRCSRRVNRILLERDAVDHAFLAEHCDGARRSCARTSPCWTGTLVDRATGLPREQIEDAGRRCRSARERTIVCWAMGLTQHRNSVATIREIVNFLLLRGMIGKPGAGVCPVRGHSNVQGDRTMGIWERPTAAFLDRMEAALGLRDAARARARRRRGDPRDARRARQGLLRDGRQLPVGAPDTAATADALRRTRLTVHVATKPNRSHLTPRPAGAAAADARAHRARRRGRSTSPSRTR